MPLLGRDKEREMEKIIMQNPIAELDGDEMTRVVWKQIKDMLICPFVELKTEYYDLSLENREKTKDQVTTDSAAAIARLGVGVKCATITPNAQRVEEYGLSKMWKSPNGTIRAYLDGTVFRKPIIVNNIKPLVSGWKKPITVARHAFGDIYRASEYKAETAGTAELVFNGEDGSQVVEKIADLKAGDVIMGQFNTEKSITSFANACFKYAISEKEDLWFSTKDTISKIYDHRFKDIFQDLYDTTYKAEFEKLGIRYKYTLIDSAVAGIMTSQGGMIWACKNYDGDVMSDMISAAFGSIAMMSSVLVSPDGKFEYEAAHGTITDLYYRYKAGEKVSVNPTAMIFAWSGALRKRGEMDGNRALMDYADALEKACIGAIEDGVLTGDLARIAGDDIEPADTDTFLSAVKERIKL